MTPSTRKAASPSCMMRALHPGADTTHAEKDAEDKIEMLMMVMVDIRKSAINDVQSPLNDVFGIS